MPPFPFLLHQEFRVPVVYQGAVKYKHGSNIRVFSDQRRKVVGFCPVGDSVDYQEEINGFEFPDKEIAGSPV